MALLVQLGEFVMGMGGEKKYLFVLVLCQGINTGERKFILPSPQLWLCDSKEIF